MALVNYSVVTDCEESDDFRTDPPQPGAAVHHGPQPALLPGAAAAALPAVQLPCRQPPGPVAHLVKGDDPQPTQNKASSQDHRYWS